MIERGGSLFFNSSPCQNYKYSGARPFRHGSQQRRGGKRSAPLHRRQATPWSWPVLLYPCSAPFPRRLHPLSSKHQVCPPSKPPANVLSTPSYVPETAEHACACSIGMLPALAVSSFSIRRYAGGSHLLVLQGHVPEEREGRCGC